MAYIKDNDGGQLLDAAQFYYTKDPITGRKILHTRGGGGGGGGITSVNGQFGPDVTLTADDIPAGANSQQFTNADKTQLDTATANITAINNQIGALTTQVNSKMSTAGGTFTGNVDMGSNDINNVQKIHVDGQAPLYIGSTIEAAGTNGPRITGTTAGEVSFVKADTQNTLININVAEPTAATHAVTKQYVDNAIAAAGGLPPSTAADANKVLAVNAQGVAQWTDVPGGAFVVTITGGPQVVTSDKTVTEIKAALDAKQFVVGYFAGTYYSVYSCTATVAKFFYANDAGTETVVIQGNTGTLSINSFVPLDQGTANAGKILSVGVNGKVGVADNIVPTPQAADDGKVLIANDQGGAEWQDLPENIYLVTFSGGNTLTCNRTVAQIKTAVDEGKVIVGYFAMSYYNLGYVSDNEIAFFKAAESYNTVIRLRDNGAVTKTDNYFVARKQDTADVGKVLTVGANGYVSPDGKPVPIPAAADVSKVLTAKADGSVEWASAGQAANGIPVGGTAGQVLSKTDAIDFNCEWKSVAVMPGSTVGDAGKVLQVNVAGNAEWVDHLDAGIIQ